MGYKSTLRWYSLHSQLHDTAMNAAASAGALMVETATAPLAASPLSATAFGPASSGWVPPPHGLPTAATELPSEVGGSSGVVGGDHRRERSLSVQYMQQQKMLYCRSGYSLNIWPDGAVNGSAVNNGYSVLRFYTVAASFALLWMDTAPDRGTTKVAIKGETSKLWLCMNQAGELYGSARKTDECEFVEEMLPNYYNAYYSVKYPLRKANGTRRWYLAIGYDGRARLGRSSRWRHWMSQFLPRSSGGGGAAAAQISIQPGNMALLPHHARLQPSAGLPPRPRARPTPTVGGSRGRLDEGRAGGRRPDRTDATAAADAAGSVTGGSSGGASRSHSTLAMAAALPGSSRQRLALSLFGFDRARHPKRKFEPHRRRSQSSHTAGKESAGDMLTT